MSPTDPYPMKTLSSLELPPVNGHAPAPVPAAAAAETPAPLPAALSAPPTLDAAWHILRRRWPIVLGAGLVAALLGAAVAGYLTPGRYSASATVHLSSRNPRTGSTDPDDFLNFQRTQIAAFKSYDVLNRLLVKPEIRELSEMQKHQGSELEWLQKDLVIDTQMGPEILRVTLTGDNPEDIEKILNALIPLYKDKFDSDETDKLNHQIERLRANMQAAEKDINNRNQVTDGPGRDLRTLEMRQSDLQTKISTLQLLLGQLQSQMRKDEADRADDERKRTKPAELVKDIDVMDKLDQSFDVRPLREELAKLNREMQDSVRLAPTPAVGEQRAEPYRRKIAALRKDIDNFYTENSGDVRKLLQEKEIQKLDAHHADLVKQIALRKKDEEDLRRELSTATTGFDEVRLQIFNLRTREERNQNSGLAKELTLKRLADEEAQMQASKAAPSRVEFKERAQVPTSRQLDKKLKFAGGAGVGMFGLVLLAVFFYEFRERRIYTQHDVARGLGMKVIGTLPFQRSRLAPTKDEQFAMLESSDALRTVLLQAGRNDGVRVVMVTSAGTGEGKTSLACQLAASLGRAGRRTLLIDGDLRNPAAHTQFNVPLTPGFAEALRGEIDPDDAIKPTSVAHLALLPAGQCDLAAIQALAQDEVQTLFFHLKEEYEFVILDVSPVLPVADALVIGQHTDAVLFSVLRDVSKLPLVYEAQQRLAALGIRLLGAVVSGERPRTYGGMTLMTPKPT